MHMIVNDHNKLERTPLLQNKKNAYKGVATD
jgi:hypothetical protein